MSVVPDWPEIGTGMSNFDHTIDDGFEERLRNEEIWGRYAGWEFNGCVWWDRKTEEFVCEVWRYHAPVDVKRAASLDDLMDVVSDDWGYE